MPGAGLDETSPRMQAALAEASALAEQAEAEREMEELEMEQDDGAVGVSETERMSPGSKQKMGLAPEADVEVYRCAPRNEPFCVPVPFSSWLTSERCFFCSHRRTPPPGGSPSEDKAERLRKQREAREAESSPRFGSPKVSEILGCDGCPVPLRLAVADIIYVSSSC